MTEHREILRQETKTALEDVLIKNASSEGFKDMYFMKFLVD